MSSFDERKKGFEKKFAHDEEKQFKINAKKNKYLATGKNIKIFIKIEMAITPDAICFLQKR